MRKIDLIRAIMELQALKILSPACAFNYVKEIMVKHSLSDIKQVNEEERANGNKNKRS